MTKDFYTEHNELIKSTVEKNQVKYTVGSSNGTNAVVHCYYVDNKKVRMVAYAIRNKKTKATRKHILELMIKPDAKNQRSGVSVRDTGEDAKQLFNLLEAKYTRQVARTQLKSGWRNPVFIIHKQR